MIKLYYSVHFYTESTDHYYAVFDDKPSNGHLSAYVKEHYPEEIDEENNTRTIFWNVEELEAESLPIPIKPIESI